MTDANSLFDLILDGFKKVLYPEEWINLDMSFSKSEIFAMLLVDKHGEIIMSQVADYVNVPMSTATGIIERLVKNGYMKRERSESDRMIVAIRLTDKGKELMSQLKNTVMGYIDEIGASLTEEEKQLLFKLFTKVISILENKDAAKTASNKAESSIKKIEIE